ncbi:reverse transcriptase domain-containing protein [Tanacetum coccineum]
MTGISRTVTVGGKPFNTEHRLNEFKYIESIKQKKRSLAPERNKAMRKKVEVLTKTNILREVKYQTWVSNPVMVKKDDRRWKLCVDFIDINKACPKDHHPLPAIDQKIEILSKFWLKCFLDAYKGYHQIQMAKRDEEKTAFFIREGVFCYKRLPFGLKDAGATYQKLVDKVFSDQIGHNLEVHVDDMVIKSDSEEDMLVDIKETFDKLRAINMKLNPSKCYFGIEEGPPESISLKGSRQDTSFLENIEELHKWEDSLMDDIIRRSFSKHEKIHRDIANGYSSNRRQNIGNVPRSLKRKHKRIVVSRVRKKAGTYVLRKPNAARSRIRLPRAGKTHTSPHTRCKKTLKILADFLAETPSAKDKETEVEETKSKDSGPENAWKLFTDGASSSNGSEAGLMLVRPEGKEYTYAFRFESETTNNEAEYKALLVGLCIAAEMKIQELAIFIDSQLVANHVKGLFEARHPIIKQYMEKTKEIVKSFSSYSIEHIRRDHNNKADALSKLALTTFSKLAMEVLVEVGRYKQRALSKRYIKAHVECMQGHSRCMPDPLIHTKKSKAGDDTYNLLMAFLLVGDRHCEATTNSTRRFGIPQVEVTNKDIIKGMERTLGKTHQGWADELPQRKQSRVPRKIEPTWEGPYIVKKAYEDGSYKLETLSGSLNDYQTDLENLHEHNKIVAKVLSFFLPNGTGFTLILATLDGLDVGLLGDVIDEDDCDDDG